MSASSISQVWGAPRSQVLEILKEIFTKFIELSNKKEEIILDLKIGNLCVNQKHELIFKNKQPKLDKTDRKREIIKIMREANESYRNIKENPATNYDVDKISSDILSMQSGSTYYVSVRTPRTKSRSVISSRLHGAVRKRSKQLSLFRSTQGYKPEMTRTTSKELNKTRWISDKKLSVRKTNSHSQYGISMPKRLFSNNGNIDQIHNKSVSSAYGSLQGKKNQNSGKSLRKKGIPYPFMASFVNKRSGGIHFGKRIAFPEKKKEKEEFSAQFKSLKDTEDQRKILKQEKRK